MALTDELAYHQRENPTNEVDVSFQNYVSNRSRKFERHLDGGIPDYAYSSADSHRRRRNIPQRKLFEKHKYHLL